MNRRESAIGNPEFPFQGTVFIGPRGSLVVNRTGYMLRPAQSGGGGRGRATGPGAAAGTAPGGRAAAAPAPAAPPAPPIEPQMVRGGPEMEMVESATTLHVNDILNCVKTRAQPVSPFHIGFYATLPCALASRSMR
ncbi:MAG: hypothetical protein ABIX28_01395, partial [Vicinamibacterales bacterium]